MKNKTKVLGIFFASVFLIALFPLVSADECSGQACDLDINLTIGNVAPNITLVAPEGATVTPTALSTTNFTINVSITDENGYDDINASSIYVEAIGGATYTTTSCVAVYEVGNDAVYECLLEWQYYAEQGAYPTTAYVTDYQGASDSKVEGTFSPNALDYVDQLVFAFGWASATLGTDDVEADNSISLYNGGNVDYGSTEITGQNATGQVYSDVIPASSFWVHSSTGQTSGGEYMIENTAVDTGGHFFLEVGNGASLTVYTYVDVPSGIQADTYLSDSAWVMDVIE